jgi:UPF0755 protein
MRQKKRKNKGCTTFLFVLFIIISIFAFIFLYSVPKKVARELGQPGSSLNLFQRAAIASNLVNEIETLKSPLSNVGDEMDFVVSEGESVQMICLRLERSGLIKAAEKFRLYLIYTGLDRQIRSGSFKLSPSISPIEISRVLTDLNRTSIPFSILPGWRLEDIASSLPTSGLTIEIQEFLDLAYNPSVDLQILIDLPDRASLEGYLFPDIYQVSRDISLQALLVQILERFNSTLTSDLRSAFSTQGFSLHEAVTLASIIQREAIIGEERPLIASVFYNRLESGMYLETDPTVQYALGFQEASNTWWKSPLFFKDLEINSLYNTYQHPGLPPGPISNPDLTSLMAVGYPAQTSYFYFRAKCDGSQLHNFAITFEEHLANECP